MPRTRPNGVMISERQIKPVRNSHARKATFGEAANLNIKMIPTTNPATWLAVVIVQSRPMD